MKQQYRHTKPIRGKDPDNKEEELSEENKEVCPRCGGWGGMHQSDSPFEGYLPCYACGL
jgi:hypothetical protein